jgi:TonB family protein
VGTDGRVEEAEIVRPAHPAYDAQLVRAARNWLYEPATRNGVAVVSELSVEVNLTPRE